MNSIDEYRNKLIEMEKKKIIYICPICGAKISRLPQNHKPCPLCKAPYNYNIDDMKKFLK